MSARPKSGLRFKVLLVMGLCLVMADAFGFVIAREAFERSEAEEALAGDQALAIAIGAELDDHIAAWQGDLEAAQERLATQPPAQALDLLLHWDISGAALVRADASVETIVGDVPLEEVGPAFASQEEVKFLTGRVVLERPLADGASILAWTNPAALQGILAAGDAHAERPDGTMALPGADARQATQDGEPDLGTWIVGTAPFMGGSARVVVATDPAEVRAHVAVLLYDFLLVTTLAYIVAGMFMGYIIARTLDPLAQITEAARRLGRNEGEIELDVETGDEIEVLATTLTESSRALARARERERQDGQALRQAAAEFELAVGETAAVAADAGVALDLAAALARSAATITGGEASVTDGDATIACAGKVREPGHASIPIGKTGWSLQIQGSVGEQAERKLRILVAQASIALARLREAENALRREARHRAILEALSDAVVLVGVDGKVQYANAAARAHGFGAGLPLDAPFEDATAIATLLAAPHDRRARPPQLTTRGHRKLEAHGGVLPLDGGQGLLLVMQDATDRLRMESEAEERRAALARSERLSALGTLVAGIAHEINNPLTYIQGNIELAILDLEGPQHRETRQSLESAVGGTRRIGQITQALRAVARQKAGAMAETFDLRIVLQNVDALLRAGLPPSVDFACEEADSPIFVRGSSTALHQVVLNLAKNAVEATQAAGGTVRISCRVEGGSAVIKVADDGPGIPPEVQAKLFTPFFTTKLEGTGLGLSIVDGIVRDHAGKMELTTAPGKGTTFRVRLPLAVGSPPKAQS